MTDEPHGHRGHPTSGEEMHAAYLRERLGATVVWLKSEGFTEDEALAFVAGVALEVAAVDGETWSSPASAASTVRRLLEGRAAKWWSLRAIGRAIDDISLLGSREA